MWKIPGLPSSADLQYLQSAVSQIFNIFNLQMLGPMESRTMHASRTGRAFSMPNEKCTVLPLNEAPCSGLPRPKSYRPPRLQRAKLRAPEGRKMIAQGAPPMPRMGGRQPWVNEPK
ncbi:hypothetical protein SBV1_2070001 [Verrucomicrobia bacterium]|nr:hypothetical protein SBV1_2070001 [Verrucomicrobiota bacterium]